jgi:uncharacterized protein (TIGR03435 family)
MTLFMIVKATVVLLSALLAARLLHRSRAAVRHLALATGFGLLLALPLASGITPVVVAVPVPVPTGPRASLVEPVNEFTLGVPERPPSDGSATFGFDRLLLTVWLAGVLVSLVPVLAGLVQLRGLRRTGLPSARAQAIATTLAAEIGLHRSSLVVSHPHVTGPITCGVFRPIIVFPSDADDWSDQAIYGALRHELEHIRRRDWLSHCVSRIVCACYWFHPLVWVAWRRLVLEAERACDDAVLQRENASAYASLLVAIAQRQSSNVLPLLLTMARRGDLAMRVSSLLDSTVRRGRAGRGIVTASIAVALMIVAVTAPLTMKAQAGQLERLEFEVASVKRNTSASDERQFRPTPGRFSARNVTLKMLVTYAYSLRDFQVIGGPDWISEHRYDIDATAVNGAAWQLQARMLQSLLADRFKLTLHREKRELPVYSLRVAVGGPRISPSPQGRCLKAEPAAPIAPADRSKACGFMGMGRDSLQATAVTMPIAAEGLSMALDRMVIDRTGLPGEFDIALKWNSVEGPSIFTAIQELLGLRLEADRGPVEVVVIERVEQPSEN